MHRGGSSAPQPAHTRTEAVTREIASVDGSINDRAIKGVNGNMNTNTCRARSSWCARRSSRVHAIAPTTAAKRDLPLPAAARLPRDDLCTALPCGSPRHQPWTLQCVARRTKKKMLTSAHSGFCCSFVSTWKGEMRVPSALISRRPRALSRQRCSPGHCGDCRCCGVEPRVAHLGPRKSTIPDEFHRPRLCKNPPPRTFYSLSKHLRCTAVNQGKLISFVLAPVITYARRLLLERWD